jgi:type IV pilus assembly protein PilN
MPKINLLPTRATAKLEAAKQELAGFMGLTLFVMFALYLWHGVVAGRIDDDIDKRNGLQSELGELEKKVTQIEDFKTQASLLEKKLTIIDTLAKARLGPAKMLDALADVLQAQPRIWLTNFVEKDGKLTLEGGAMDQQDVSSFQMSLAQRTAFFRDLKLNLVKQGEGNEADVLVWTLQCTPLYEAG